MHEFLLTGDRGFESSSLQQRICEPSVPQRQRPSVDGRRSGPSWSTWSRGFRPRQVMPGPDFDGASRDDVLWRLFTVGSSCTRCSGSAYRPTGWLTSTRGTGRPKYRPIDDHQMIRGDLVTTSLRFMTWGCVTLLAVLSLLHTQDMVRTSLPGQLERFIAYAGSAAIAMVGYGLSRAVCGSLAAFGSMLAFSKTSRTFRPAGIRLWRISRRRHSEHCMAGWPLWRFLALRRPLISAALPRLTSASAVRFIRPSLEDSLKLREAIGQSAGTARFASVRKAGRRRVHRDDHPPDLCPSNQSILVAAPAHQIGILRGLEFGVAPVTVHHQLSSTQDIHIRDHHATLRRSQTYLTFG